MGRPDYILLEDTDLNQAKLWDDIVEKHIRKPHQGYNMKPNSDKGEFWLELNNKIQEKSTESYRTHMQNSHPSLGEIPWVYFTEDEALHKAQIGRTRMIEKQTKERELEIEKARRGNVNPHPNPQGDIAYIDGPEPRILEYKDDYIKKPMPTPKNKGIFHGDATLQKLIAWKENHTRLQSPQMNHQPGIQPSNMQHEDRIYQRQESPSRQPQLRPAFRPASPRQMQLQHRLRGVSPPRQAPPLQHQEWRAWV
jgi:hypothetical protein